MAVHVRFNSWYISLPSSAKRQREMTKFYVVRGRERRRLIFKIYIPNLTMRSIFNFERVVTVRNKNDFRVSRDTQVKYKLFFFNRRCPRRRRRGFLMKLFVAIHTGRYKK